MASRMSIAGGASSDAPLWAQWRAASVAGGWPVSDVRWWSREALAVAEALAEMTPTPDGCVSLGRQRASAGLTLAEARTDLRIGLRVSGAGSGPTDPIAIALVDALIDGWIDQALADVGSDCRDPLTRLVSWTYFGTRLNDIYRGATRRGANVSDRYALVVIRCLDAPSFLHREARLAVVRQLVDDQLSPDEAIARLGPNTAATLVRRDAGLAAALAQLRIELLLARHDGQLAASQLWLENLPPDPAEVTELLRRLRR
jgi:hypothetical protein